MNQRPTPRRRKKTAAARLRPFWILLVLALLVAALLGYVFVTWPALRPHTVAIDGNRVVSKEDIAKAAAVDLQANMWLQNTHAMDARIEAIPYIATAAVHREPPATMRISVTERKPFARIKTADGLFIVDRDLRVLQADDGRFALLPLMLDPTVTGARPGAMLKASSAIALRDDEEALAQAALLPAVLQHDKYGDLVATLRNGVRVLFGDEGDLQKKIRLVDPILTQVGRAGRPISAIDLRAPNTPVVVYKK